MIVRHYYHLENYCVIWSVLSMTYILGKLQLIPRGIEQFAEVVHFSSEPFRKRFYQSDPSALDAGLSPEKANGLLGLTTLRLTAFDSNKELSKARTHMVIRSI
ncbi:hypothetical protein PABG_02143 [Paracoccidioides brasiliensis Pb03]|nr:hypothetical protein PABG_02143 [Paracoccidioides brasiliensis Pb03]